MNQTQNSNHLQTSSIRNRIGLSVAMCTYNGEVYLLDQLESIQSQTRLPEEIVICDDGSRDATLEIIRAFATRVSFPVRLHVNDQNLGVTKNFEKAISLCSGSVIVLSDQDDVWLPQKLEKLESIFLEDPQVGLVFSNAQLIDEDGKLVNKKISQAHCFTPREQAKISQNRGTEVLLKHFMTLGATIAFHARLKPLILPIPPFWAHDWWVGLVCLALARGVFVPECLIHYRQHSAQLTGVKKYTLAQTATRVTGKHSPNRYQLEAKRYEALLERLSSHQAVLISPDLQKRIGQKVKHVWTRTRIRKGLPYRFPLVLLELITLRYSRYSASWTCALADFLYWGKR